MRAASIGSTGTVYVTFDSGKTVMDALLATASTANITVDYTNSSYGAYVTGIGGLTAGGSAGWMYKVNGETPMTRGQQLRPAERRHHCVGLCLVVQ